MASTIIKYSAFQKSVNALLHDLYPEQMRATKHTVGDGYLLELMRLYSTMYHEWSTLQKDVSDTMDAVSSLDWSVTPYVENGKKPTAAAQQAADTVSRAIWHTASQEPGTFAHNFLDLTGAMLDGLYRGHSVHEIIWRRTSSLVYPAEYKQVDPQFYVWETDPDKADKLLMAPDGMDYTKLRPFPPHRFIIALNTTGSDHPVYNSIFYSLISYFAAVKFGLPWMQQYCQRYSHPVFQFNCNSDEEILRLKQQLDECEDVYRIFIKGEGDMKVTPIPAAAGNPHEILLRVAENACHQAILGQTLTSDTSDNGGSRAQAEVHLGVQKAVVMKRAEYVARVLNRQLVPAIIAMNYGKLEGVPMPEIKFAMPDDGANIERAAYWAQVLAIPGVRVAKETIYESLRLPIPGDNEDTLGGSAAPTDALKNAAPGKDDDDDDPDPDKPRRTPADAPATDDVKGAAADAPAASTDSAAERALKDWGAPVREKLRQWLTEGVPLREIRARLRELKPDTTALATALSNQFRAGLQDDNVETANPYGCNQYGEGWKEPHEGNSTGYQQMGAGKPKRKVLTTEHGGNKVEKVTHEKRPGKGSYEHADNDSLDKTANEEREKREKEKGAQNTNAGVDAFAERIEKAVDKATADRFREQMTNAPEEARALFEKYKGDIEIQTTNKGSYCITKIPPLVALDTANNNSNSRYRVPGQSLLHEVAHALDRHAGDKQFNLSPRLQEAIDADVKDVFARKRKELEAEYGRKVRIDDVRNELKNELNSLGTGLAPITDAFGAHRVFADLSHSESYFKKRPSAGYSETFANLYASHTLQDKKMIDAAKKYLPRTYEQFIDILKEHTKGEKS